MLRKVMPYVPYLVVIISLIVAIVMVISLNGQDSHPPVKKGAKSQTAGKVAESGSNPTYKVRTTPVARPTVTSSPAASTPKEPTNPTPAASQTATVTPAASGNTELTNTGPGEVIILFAASAAFAAIAHSLYVRRKLSA